MISGNVKTMLGFSYLERRIKLSHLLLTPFSTMFNAAFGMSGVVPEDNALVAAVQTVLGFETPMIMLLSFVINIILARITPFKYIFLTGHMMFSFAGTMAIVLDQMGINGWDGSCHRFCCPGNLYGRISCNRSALYKENFKDG